MAMTSYAFIYRSGDRIMVLRDANDHWESTVLNEWGEKDFLKLKPQEAEIVEIMQDIELYDEGEVPPNRPGRVLKMRRICMVQTDNGASACEFFDPVIHGIPGSHDEARKQLKDALAKSQADA
jgi:hypothetical protein